MKEKYEGASIYDTMEQFGRGRVSLSDARSLRILDTHPIIQLFIEHAEMNS